MEDSALIFKLRNRTPLWMLPSLDGSPEGPQRRSVELLRSVSHLGSASRREGPNRAPRA